MVTKKLYRNTLRFLLSKVQIIYGIFRGFGAHFTCELTYPAAGVQIVVCGEVSFEEKSIESKK